jgi:uncharacterized circularly permuted ATP-grasp superfamily protein
MNVEARVALRPDEDPLAAYASARNGGYDELMDAAGDVRPQWRKFLSALAELSPEEQAQRADRLNRRVREMGIAHDIFADPTQPGKRWDVDLVPLIFASEQWRALEMALIQRARLLNAIVADTYGEQRLMREGLIPPALMFSDSAYLSACQDIQPATGHVQFYAVDLAREANGDWRVIDNHT